IGAQRHAGAGWSKDEARPTRRDAQRLEPLVSAPFAKVCDPRLAAFRKDREHAEGGGFKTILQGGCAGSRSTRGGTSSMSSSLATWKWENSMRAGTSSTICIDALSRR